MQPIKVALNGSLTKKKNYLWGGALTLAWQELKTHVIKEDIKLVQKIVHNYNNCPFNKNHLSDDCFYAKVGYGNKTVRTINEEIQKKFSEKTTDRLPQNLDDKDIIAYGYFFKKLLFEYPFEKVNSVMFSGKEVQGFTGRSEKQKMQVLVHSYKNRENFIVSLKTKSLKDEVYLIKSEEESSAEQILKQMKTIKTSPIPLNKQDIFRMPIVRIKHTRTVRELVNKALLNENFKDYVISQIQEILKLEIDQTGVKAENEGSFSMKLTSLKKPVIEPKQIIIDRAFWLVMKEIGKQPYLLSHIKDPYDV